MAADHRPALRPLRGGQPGVGPWRASSAGDLAPAGDRHRLAANLEVLELLAALDREGRQPVGAEQDSLARWSGWGSLPKIFDEAAAEYAPERQRLRELLDQDQWAAATRTTLNAHYTDFEVAAAMWGFVAAAGFPGGRVLEPGVGSGTFLSTVPEGLEISATGVELDPTTAAVARYLHPDATIRAESFAVTRFPDGWFDLAIGNVPFGSYSLFDPIYNPHRMAIHNHFVAKSLTLVHPGGYVALLTSRFTAEAGSTAARAEIARLGDLVGAVRLPEGAMRAVAGTGVAMDLLVLRRREPGAAPGGLEWIDVVPVETPDGPVHINRVFADHPGWVLGELRAEHGQYGKDDLEVRPLPGPLRPRLDAVLAEIAEQARTSGLGFTARPTPAADVEADVVTDARIGPHHVEGSLVATASGGFGRLVDGVAVAHRPPATQADELRSLIDLRDIYFEVIDAQASGAPDPIWQAARARLSDLYDRYASVYGPVNRYREVDTGRFDPDGIPIRRRLYPAMGGFRDDPGKPVVMSLEHFDDATHTATKAQVFTHRLLAPRPVATTAERPEDALAICLDERGSVDTDRIADLLRVNPDDARQRLGALVFDDPVGGPPLPAAAYLSGNVRQRLADARAAAEAEPRFKANVEALETVQPRDLEPGEIEARLGASWIPAADVAGFCAEVLETAVNAEYSPVAGEWAIKPTGGRWSVALTSDWGTGRVDGIRLVEACANQRQVTVTDEGPDGTRVPNLGETLAAREKAELIGERFAKWVWEDPGRAERLAGEYNRRFNSVVLPAWDGSHLSLPGLAAEFRPHPHQRDAVWRMLSEPAVLMAHDVGAGKTASMVMGGAELKRLGMIAKPLYVVPNHMLEQFSREYLQLYPAARLLVASKDDTGPAGRKAFVARCANQDWDGVIITASAFERIPVSADTESAFIDARVSELRVALSASRAEGGLTVKAIERAIARAEERQARLVTDGRRDSGGVCFEATGVDYLIVDEAHAFKNLDIASRISGVGGPGSKRAVDLAMKLDWLRQTHGARVATFATATPISNSIAELYVMQRYLQPDTLATAGVEHFDGWAANFGRTVTALELAPDASTYRMHTRFARFANVPDLLRMFAQVADVRSRDQLGLALPALVGDKPETVVVQGSPELHAYVETLARRAEAIHNRAVHSEEDNMLKVSGDGRRAALDVRLVGLPDPDDGGKIAAAADRIAGIWTRTATNAYTEADGARSDRPGGLQLVFCDQGTPNPDGRWSVYDALRTELVARGIPYEAVRFMHDAKGDAEKARLFAAARSGAVSVLIGSTEKMGVGTNVQARAVALHHLDCPWRPADLEQRDGRILRQGNQNASVEIVRYVTEGSFDVYSWQTVERKAGFINQVMAGEVTERSIDDIGDAALSYAEVKALATGNPLIMERAGVEAEATRLARLAGAHRDDQARLARIVRGAERDAGGHDERAAAYRAAATKVIDTSGDRFRIEVDHVAYDRRPAAATALAATLDRQMRAVPIGQRQSFTIGALAGFEVTATISHDTGGATANLGLVGVPRTTTTFERPDLRDNPQGLLTRLENLAADLPARASRAEADAREARAEAARAAARLGAPFEHAGRLEALRARLAAIDAELTPPDDPSPGQPTQKPPTAGTQLAPALSGAAARSSADLAQERLARPAARSRGGFGR